MDMSKFLVDDYFTTYEPKARYMMAALTRNLCGYRR